MGILKRGLSNEFIQAFGTTVVEDSQIEVSATVSLTYEIE